MSNNKNLELRLTWTLMLRSNNVNYLNTKKFKKENSWSPLELQWSYYGGSFEGERVDSDFLSLIEKTGIDWSKTTNIESNTKDTFNGTFADSTVNEVSTGTLYLLDGSSYYIGAVDTFEIDKKMLAILELVTNQAQLFK